MMMTLIVQAQRLPNRQRRVRVESCCLGGRRLFAWQVLKAVLVMMMMRMVRMRMRMMTRMMMMRMMMIHLWGWVSYLFHIFMGSFYCREFPMYSECLVISASFKNHKFLRSQLSLLVLHGGCSPLGSVDPLLSLHRIHNYLIALKIITDHNYRPSNRCQSARPIIAE